MTSNQVEKMKIDFIGNDDGIFTYSIKPTLPINIAADHLFPRLKNYLRKYKPSDKKCVELKKNMCFLMEIEKKVGNVKLKTIFTLIKDKYDAATGFQFFFEYNDIPSDIEYFLNQDKFSDFEKDEIYKAYTEIVESVKNTLAKFNAKNRLEMPGFFVNLFKGK